MPRGSDGPKTRHSHAHAFDITGDVLLCFCNDTDAHATLVSNAVPLILRLTKRQGRPLLTLPHTQNGHGVTIPCTVPRSARPTPVRSHPSIYPSTHPSTHLSTHPSIFRHCSFLNVASSDLVTHGRVSSTHNLHSFNVREQHHERVISWYDQNNSLVLKHLSKLELVRNIGRAEHFSAVPRGKVPYTKQDSLKVTYCDLSGLSEIPHGFVFDVAVERPQMLTPFYFFKNEQQSLRFQCAARQRQLLHTFHTHHIGTKQGVISYKQQLKLWQKPDSPDVTFTFFAHVGGVDPIHHYEFDLLWFKQDAKRNGKGLVLTFYTHSDERSIDCRTGFLSAFHHRSSDNNHRSRRTSAHSRSSSGSSNHRALPDGERVVVENTVYLHWRSLHIEFENDHGQSEALRVQLPLLTDTVKMRNGSWLSATSQTVLLDQASPTSRYGRLAMGSKRRCTCLSLFLARTPPVGGLRTFPQLYQGKTMQCMY
jgi:hypothetical protein